MYYYARIRAAVVAVLLQVYQMYGRGSYHALITVCGTYMELNSILIADKKKT